MYSINVHTVAVNFESALIALPRGGSDPDWLCDDWVDTPQPIDVIQTSGGATVTTKMGRPPEKGAHVVQPIQPLIYTELEVVEYFVQLASTNKLSRESVVKAITIKNFPWGKLLSLNWGSLGDAPGGTEYCLLPIDSFAISLGFLRLKWGTVKIKQKE